MKPNRPNILQRLRHWANDIWYVYTIETRRVFSDSGVMLIFFFAGLVYPILYNLIYWNDDLEDVPIAVVDDSRSPESRRFIKGLDATPQVGVAATCLNMQEAEQLMRERRVNGIVYFPSDYAERLTRADGQAHISVYNDMSSFLYFKNLSMGVNYVMLQEGHDIQMRRYSMTGRVGEEALQLVEEVPYHEIGLFNETGGYSSFLIIIILVLAVHQTLFFGIGMLSGTAREEDDQLFYIPGRNHERSISRIIFGRAMCYFIIYLGITVWCFLLIPRIFHLPHVGDPMQIMRFSVPFLLSTIFFSMTVSTFVRQRETGMVTMLSSTLLLIFISGVPWPDVIMPRFWSLLACVFPSTFGIRGFVAMNSMGGTLNTVAPEYMALWLQTGIYFILACASLYGTAKVYELRSRHSDEELSRHSVQEPDEAAAASGAE